MTNYLSWQVRKIIKHIRRENTVVLAFAYLFIQTGIAQADKVACLLPKYLERGSDI